MKINTKDRDRIEDREENRIENRIEGEGGIEGEGEGEEKKEDTSISSPSSPENGYSTTGAQKNTRKLYKINNITPDNKSMVLEKSHHEKITNTHNINFIKLRKRKKRFEPPIGVCLPQETRSWLEKMSTETGESVSAIVRKIVIAAHSARPAPAPYVAPTVVLNYNVARAEARVKPSEFVARTLLSDLLERVRQLEERAKRERREGTALTSFTTETAERLEREILRTLRGARSIPPDMLQEMEAALKVLRALRGGAFR